MVGRVMIMAGGTGGHIFPALAVAERLCAEGVEVRWLGTRRGMEARLVPEAGLPIDYISISGLRGKGKLSLLLAPLRLVLALSQSLWVMLRRRPEVVLGMGGFVSGPGGLAAWLMRRPLLIHEQNAIPGMTNRLLSHLAVKVLEAFPGTFTPQRHALPVGNPVREAITQLPEVAKRLQEREGALRLLIVGGSQGAHALNTLVPAAIGSLAAHKRPEVWHQTGSADLEAVQAVYAQQGATAKVAAFIDDMAEAYGWADLVICRAGAMTISELAAAGLGSLLVPFPYAVDDHQTRNAQFLVEQGAAVLLPQSELSSEALAELLSEFVEDAEQGRSRLTSMAESAAKQARPEAGQRIARFCQEAAGV